MHVDDCAPILTVAIPSYNVERYLAHGLASYDDDRLEGRIEVLVIDDGSSDGTRGIADSFALRRPSIFRVISQKNAGHGGAVNTGLREARGVYFRVVDGDDWVNTDGLVDLCKRLVHLDADVVIDKKREVHMGTGESRLFELAGSPLLDAAIPFQSVCCDRDLLSQFMIHTLTVRTAFARAAGVLLLEHTFYEDFEFVVKCTAPAQTIAFEDIEVYQYLVGNASQSVSHENYVKRWEDHTRVVDAMLDYLDSCGLEGVALKYLRYKIRLLVHTHYNIALLFDADRSRGRARAKVFRRMLRSRDTALTKETDARYLSALTLNVLHLSYARPRKNV